MATSTAHRIPRLARKARAARKARPQVAQQRTLVSPLARNSRRGKIIYRLVLTAVILIFTAVFLLPMYWMVIGGLKPTHELLQSPPTLYPHHLQTNLYGKAWNQLDLGRYLVNTAYYAAGALVFQLVIDVTAAFALSRLRPLFGRVILFLMLATLMIPSMVLLIPQYLTVLKLPIVHWNLLNTPFAIWLPAAANATNIFLLKRFFDAIPRELLEAAEIDGAGAVKILWKIVLPISRPILGVVSIVAVVAVWKDFVWPLLVLTDPAKQTVSLAVVQLSSNTPQNVLTAALVIASVPTILVFLLFQRNIMAGLTAGGIRG